MRILPFLLVLAAALPCDPVRAAGLTPAQALKMLTSEGRAEREAAGLGFRSQGAGIREVYRTVLEKAETVHKDRLMSRIEGAMPVLGKFSEVLKEWSAARDSCLDLVFKKTDHESKKLAELARSYAAAEKAMKELSKHLKNPPAGLTQWEGAAEALNEIAGELAWCRDAGEEDRRHFREAPAKERAMEMPKGKEFLELIGPYQERLAAQADFEKTALFNSNEIRWPAPPLKLFMELINARRYTVGQQTLRLDERLSNCARGHSQEMQDLKFFSHESPTEKNKTPWARAKNAEFEGNCTGENIFMGSPSPEAAYMAWWESDGHRFIMFQKDANTLGLGLVGVHWTLNTGNRVWPETAAGGGGRPR